MQTLIAGIARQAGISEDIAQKAVAIILKFLVSEGPKDKIAALLDDMPEVKAMVGDAEDAKGGKSLLGSILGGGGVMATFSELSGLGLEMGEIQTIAEKTIDYAKEKAGEETVNDIIGSIPGLSQLI
ncbi:MAG: hypothetical protein COA52_18230 [Hyphomicrobiales bacterium]|nr:MAG: hypothetical protein COA52_18230 [Hyphomicrobiales bacterium]